MQFTNDGKTPYTSAKFIQKAHHEVLASGIYDDACKYLRKIPRENKRGLDSRFFADKYHDLKLTTNNSAGNIVYHSVDNVVPNGDIASELDNLEMAETAEKSHADQLMETILHMNNTNKIIG